MSFLKAVRDHYGEPELPRPPSPPTLAAVPNSEDTPYGLAALADECEIVAQAHEGTRNDTLNTAAFRMGRIVAAGHLTEATARDNLTSAAHSAGLRGAEIGATINSGLRKGIQHPRHVEERPAPAPITAWTPDQLDDEDAFWGARPILEHLRTFARARRACPWAVLGVVLARVIAQTPRWVVLPPLVGDDASLNLFVALVAPSGGGKGASEAAAAAALDVGTVDTAGVGSGEGIAHLFLRRTKDGVEQHRDAVLMQVTEIDTLAALGDRKGATLLPELRKAWSGERLGFAYADPAKALPLDAHAYRLCLVAGVQPGRAQWVLDDVDGGTPQRFLWLPAIDPHAPDQPPPCPEQATWTRPRMGYGAGAANHVTGRVAMGVCDTARTTIDQARLARLRGDGQALDGHALLTRLKAAAALALLDQRHDVTDEDWELSATLAALSERTRGRIVDHLKSDAAARNQGKAEAEAARAVVIAERVEDAAVKRVCRVVRRHLASGPKVRGELSRSVAHRDRQYLDDALARLQEAGQIKADEAGSGGTRWSLS